MFPTKNQWLDSEIHLCAHGLPHSRHYVEYVDLGGSSSQEAESSSNKPSSSNCRCWLDTTESQKSKTSTRTCVGLKLSLRKIWRLPGPMPDLRRPNQKQSQNSSCWEVAASSVRRPALRVSSLGFPTFLFISGTSVVKSKVLLGCAVAARSQWLGSETTCHSCKIQ